MSLKKIIISIFDYEFSNVNEKQNGVEMYYHE